MGIKESANLFGKLYGYSQFPTYYYEFNQGRVFVYRGLS